MSGMYWNCTVDCERVVDCTVCGKRKAPLGRSVPLPACNSYCDWDCRGYRNDPKPGHLWPGELEQIREYEQGEQP